MDKQTFRDYCAAMAMQGLVGVGLPALRDPAALAIKAFDIADVMAQEREHRLFRDRGDGK